MNKKIIFVSLILVLFVSGCGMINEGIVGENSKLNDCLNLVEEQGYQCFPPEEMAPPVNCVIPTSGMVITEDTTLCSGTYELEEGITIDADDITLTCEGTVLAGPGMTLPYTGIILDARQGVTVQDCEVIEWMYGIELEGSFDNSILNNFAHNNNVGIRIQSGSSGMPNTITYNTLNNNQVGLRGYGGVYANIIENTINYNMFQGIYFYNPVVNTNVRGNTITHNSYSVGPGGGGAGIKFGGGGAYTSIVEDNFVCWNGPTTTPTDFTCNYGYPSTFGTNTYDTQSGCNIPPELQIVCPPQ